MPGLTHCFSNVGSQRKRVPGAAKGLRKTDNDIDGRTPDVAYEARVRFAWNNIGV